MRLQSGNPFAWGLGFLILLAAGPALADTGMAFLDLGMMQLAIVAIVVVALETGALKAAFKQSFGSLVGLVAVVNLASYLVGLPLLWLVSNEGPLYVLINQYRNPLLSLGLMAAAFVLTVLVEWPLLVAGLKKDKRVVFKACLGANALSYVLVTLLSFQFTYFPDNGIRDLFRPSPEGASQAAPSEPDMMLEPLERPQD